MPTYHFRCGTCQKEKDMKLPFGSVEKPSCDECKIVMEKFIVPPHVHFKGGGFYKTDSGKAGSQKSAATPPATPPATTTPTPPPPPSA